MTPNCFECDDRTGIIKHRRQWHHVQCYKESALDRNYFDGRSNLGLEDILGDRQDSDVEP